MEAGETGRIWGTGKNEIRIKCIKTSNEKIKWKKASKVQNNLNKK